MGQGMFTISDTNPNDVAGGGGCLCAPTKLPCAGPPYAVFHGTEMLDTGSPYAVLCLSCAGQAVKQVEGTPCCGGTQCQTPPPVVGIPYVDNAGHIPEVEPVDVTDIAANEQAKAKLAKTFADSVRDSPPDSANHVPAHKRGKAVL